MDGFRYLSVDHTLEVVDSVSATFRSEHQFVLEASSPLRFYVRRYWWTGSGSDDALPDFISEIDQWGHPKHRIHGRMITEGDSRIVVVDLGRNLMPGETESVHFKHRMKDLNGTFQPYLRVGSEMVADTVNLKVVLPESLAKDVFHEIADGTSDHAISVDKLTGKQLENRRFSFECSFPKLVPKKNSHKVRWSKTSAGP